MPEEKLKILYDKFGTQYDLGAYEQFVQKMQVPEKREVFYNTVSDKYDLGDFQTFENKIAIEPEKTRGQNPFVKFAEEWQAGREEDFEEREAKNVITNALADVLDIPFVAGDIATGKYLKAKEQEGAFKQSVSVLAEAGKFPAEIAQFFLQSWSDVITAAEVPGTGLPLINPLTTPEMRQEAQERIGKHPIFTLIGMLGGGFLTKGALARSGKQKGAKIEPKPTEKVVEEQAIKEVGEQKVVEKAKARIKKAEGGDKIKAMEEGIETTKDATIRQNREYIDQYLGLKERPKDLTFEEFVKREEVKAKEPLKTEQPIEKIIEPKKTVEAVALADEFVSVLKEAKPLRGKQERIYTKERGIKLKKFQAKGAKVSGEAGFKAQRAQLAGEMTQVQFESIREKFPQEKIDGLFNQIKETKKVGEWEKITAGNEFGKILEGKVPTKGGIKVLTEIFGKDLPKALQNKIPLFQRFKSAALELVNIPRSLMASFDLSYGLRQGIFTVARHPKIFFNNFSKQFRMFGSEKYYQEVMGQIHSRSNFKTMQENKLSLTELGDLAKREESFMSNWAEKIPIAGRVVRASSRAYTGFANRLRADLFDYMFEYGEKIGALEDPKYLKDAASFINHATGRGSLKSLENSMVTLNTVFFSPRLILSRLQLLNPFYYMKLEPIVRREALKSLFSFGGMALTVGALGKMSGMNVEADPRNADFLKLKAGNTRYDILGGFQQPIRAASQMISGKIISSTTGKTLTLGEGYKPLTRLDIAARFFEYKEAPIISFVASLLKGQTAIGEKVDVPTEVVNRLVPMVAQDMKELYDENGLEGIPMAAPAIFGVGVQTYGGVQSYGLDGKDYPKLNKELQRVQSTMGFPSTSAFGQEFSNGEYKKFKAESGKAIAKELNVLINSKEYKKSPDHVKRKMIGFTVDETKSYLKDKLFPDKFEISEWKKSYVEQGMDETEAQKLAEKKVKK